MYKYRASPPIQLTGALSHTTDWCINNLRAASRRCALFNVSRATLAGLGGEGRALLLHTMADESVIDPKIEEIDDDAPGK